MHSYVSCGCPTRRLSPCAPLAYHCACLQRSLAARRTPHDSSGTSAAAATRPAAGGAPLKWDSHSIVASEVELEGRGRVASTVDWARDHAGQWSAVTSTLQARTTPLTQACTTLPAGTNDANNHTHTHTNAIHIRTIHLHSTPAAEPHVSTSQASARAPVDERAFDLTRALNSGP